LLPSSARRLIIPVLVRFPRVASLIHSSQFSVPVPFAQALCRLQSNAQLCCPSQSIFLAQGSARTLTRCHCERTSAALSIPFCTFCSALLQRTLVERCLSHIFSRCTAAVDTIHFLRADSSYSRRPTRSLHICLLFLISVASSHSLFLPPIFIIVPLFSFSCLSSSVRFVYFFHSSVVSYISSFHSLLFILHSAVSDDLFLLLFLCPSLLCIAYHYHYRPPPLRSPPPVSAAVRPFSLCAFL
jgi:hypothetical protein